jgi:Zn-dependent protease
MDLARGSLRIGRVAGINVYIHFLFLLWMGYQLFSAGDDWKWTLIFMTVLFAIVLLHEFGHCFGARAVGGDAVQIVLWPLGGLAYAHAPMRPWPQFVTVACGPLVNLGLCLLSASIFIATLGPERAWALISPFDREYVPLKYDWMPYLILFYKINFGLLAFNLLPIYPLDGGQLLHTILWPFLGLQRSMIASCYIGLAGAAYLAYTGIQGGSGGFRIAIGIFGGLTCLQMLQRAKQGMLIDDSFIAPVNRRPRKPIFGGLFRKRGAAEPQNPNPGGWDERVNEEERLDRELDRILQKVHDHGIESLSYVERQTLERATRARREREQRFEQQTRL